MTPENQPNLWQQLDHFYNVMSGVQASLQNPKRKQMLGELLTQFKTYRAEAEETVPALVRKMHKDGEDLKAWAESYQHELQKMQQEVEERLKAEAAPAPEPPPPVAPLVAPSVPGLAAGLASELLARFAPSSARPAVDDRVDEGSVSKHWEETDVAEPPTPASAAKPPSPKPPSPQPKKAPSADDVSDLSVRSWDENDE